MPDEPITPQGSDSESDVAGIPPTPPASGDGAFLDPPGASNEPTPPTAPDTPDESSDVSPLITEESEKNVFGKIFAGNRAVATILGIILLVGGITTGVVLVGKSQEVRIGAWDCSKYVFEVSQDGVVTVRNGSTRDEPVQQAKVFINGNQTTTLNVPALDAGDAATLGTVSVPGDGNFSWEVKGTRDCEDSGSYQASPTATPTPVISPSQTPTPTTGPSPTPTATPPISATPTVTLVPSPSPTIPETEAACNDVKTYDADWNLLTSTDLSQLRAADVVRFAVSGTASSGSFDKARLKDSSQHH